MRPVGNALELKLCKIPTIGTQSENQTLPTGNISLGSPNVFSIWALHFRLKTPRGYFLALNLAHSKTHLNSSQL
ncbi:hypothetical protein NHP190020_17450 [Helicobacter suis]|uniref:Uncharacterized protein n=1 Tax=Helicobacter suis TaxID=104628 RepID=A0A6J4CZX7_9HELI|nr:hypothetical protein NHP190020_17450 [Helicobacter suis]BCD71036.1 hypothetical protein SNTW_16810 [Helicobacter suis]